MSQSNEARKPVGRPSLLSPEQQNALEQSPITPEAAPASPVGKARRKQVWLVAGLAFLAMAATIGVMQFGQEEQPAVTLAAAPAAKPVPAPVAPLPTPPAATTPAAASPLEALASAAPSTDVAAIVDETPPPVDAKPKESLAQMLERGVPPASKAVAQKPVRKPVPAKPVKPAEKAPAKPAAEPDNDVELLAALVAHGKFDTSANARMSLPKALEQCKKQGTQEAARCRIRVCEGRWKKDECRVYSRSKLDKAAAGN